MATKRPTKKGPAKSGPSNPPDAHYIERLQATADERGEYMVRMFVAAVERKIQIPYEVLQSLADAMKCLVGDEPLVARTRKFAKSMNLSKRQGRPKNDTPETACEYWTARHQGCSRAEALEIAATYTGKDVRTVERDVKKYPDLEEFCGEILRIVRSKGSASDKK